MKATSKRIALRLVRFSLAGLACAGFAGQASAQDKPTLSKYVAEGYQIIHTEIGNPFLQFILRKDNTLVWCSVLLQSGETSSCKTLK
jgi:hypothetical protein